MSTFTNPMNCSMDISFTYIVIIPIIMIQVNISITHPCTLMMSEKAKMKMFYMAQNVV